MAIRVALTPTLERCIEGAARHEFLKATNAYLQTGREDKELEEKIGLLRMFLETADFRKLRAESERHLTEGKKVKFVLYLEDGRPRCELSVNR